MSVHRRTLVASFPAGVAALLCACSGGISPTALGMLPAPKLPEMPKIAFEAEDPVVGSPIDVYSNVARGALTCWFGAKGPLKGQFIYHGEAEPPSKGARADIVIHAIDPSAPSPRGLRAFRVTIKADGDRTVLAAENLKMPEPLAQQMKDDVRRWAAGESGCSGVNSQAQWAPGAAETAAAKPARKAKGK